MKDFADAVQRFVDSPPGLLTAGGVLAGITWKFFEKVESILSDQTKLEIAGWLRGVDVEKKVEPWPETFAKVFDRVFGTRHLSWRCFWRSSVASVLSVVLVCLFLFAHNPIYFKVIWGNFLAYPVVWLTCMVVANVIPDYLSLLETRWVLSRMRITSISAQLVRFARWATLLLLLDIAVTYLIADLASRSASHLTGWLYGIVRKRWVDSILQADDRAISPGFVGLVVITASFRLQIIIDFLENYGGRIWLWVYPAFFTSIWLWLYVSAGFLVKTARRFQICFDFFNRKVDIEKKPLSAIGLVAGALVAVAYWGASVAFYFVARWAKPH